MLRHASLPFTSGDAAAYSRAKAPSSFVWPMGLFAHVSAIQLDNLCSVSACVATSNASQRRVCQKQQSARVGPTTCPCLRMRNHFHMQAIAAHNSQKMKAHKRWLLHVLQPLLHSPCRTILACAKLPYLPKVISHCHSRVARQTSM